MKQKSEAELAYERNVLEWKKKYNWVQPPFDPSRVIAVKKCGMRGCGAKTKLHRHHRGHEYLLARIMPDVYAIRYLSFHPDDIVIVCQKHHSDLHRLYMPYIYDLPDAPTHAELEDLRMVLRNVCDTYLRGGKKKKHDKTSKKQHRSRTNLRP